MSNSCFSNTPFTVTLTLTLLLASWMAEEKENSHSNNNSPSQNLTKFEELFKLVSQKEKMPQKHKRWSTSSVIRESQDKATVRHCFTPTRMAAIRKVDKSSTDEDVEKLSPSYIVGGNVKGHRHFGNQFGSSSKC